MINIPLRLKELREKNCLTQEEVAAVMKVSRSSYTYYECGRVKPGLSGLELLREFYGLSWDQLMQEEEEKPTVRCGMGIRTCPTGAVRFRYGFGDGKDKTKAAKKAAENNKQ